MVTINGMTHLKKIFSLWTGTEKRFIGNTLCSSDDSATQLIHILHSSCQVMPYKALEIAKDMRGPSQLFFAASKVQADSCTEPRSTVRDVLLKRLEFRAYKLQLV
jgi:hypothetical protein